MKLEQKDVPVLLKRKYNTWKFISSDNIGMSIRREGLLETALKEHQHFLRIILKWRTPHLARYYHFTPLSATKTIGFLQKTYVRPSYKFCNIHRKTPVLVSLSNEVAGLCSTVIPCEYCEICKNTFIYRTPPVAASM